MIRMSFALKKVFQRSGDPPFNRDYRICDKITSNFFKVYIELATYKGTVTKVNLL